MPALPNAAHRHSGQRIQRDELEAGRDGEDAAAFAVAVAAPVGNAATGIAARRDRAALPFIQAVHPQRFPGRRIDGHDVAADAGAYIENPVGHERRRAVVVLRHGAEVIGLPAPGDAQLGDIVAIDLIQRGIAAAAQIAAVVQPLDGGGNRLVPAAGGSAGGTTQPFAWRMRVSAAA